MRRSGMLHLPMRKDLGTSHTNAHTRYTSRNSSKGAFSYMCAPLKSGTVTMLLTIPKRYRKKNILVNMGLSSIGTAIIFLLAKLHTFSLNSK